MKHETQRMMVGELIDWQADLLPHQDGAILPDMLREAGIDPDDAKSMKIVVECWWPEHVLTPRPNGDMTISVC